MDRRSMVRKLRSSDLMKSQVSHTPPSTPKPIRKKMRLSTNNQNGKQSSDNSNATHPDESDDLLQIEKSNENRDESMHSDDSIQGEKSNENGSDSMKDTSASNTSQSGNNNTGKSNTGKQRKRHDALQYDGHTWHVSKSLKDGETIYYDCAQ